MEKEAVRLGISGKSIPRPVSLGLFPQVPEIDDEAARRVSPPVGLGFLIVYLGEIRAMSVDNGVNQSAIAGLANIVVAIFVH